MSGPSEVLGAAQARATADRFYAAINARDLDDCLAQLADDVHIEVDSRTLQGREAARAYLDGIVATYPGLRIDRRQIVAATPDTVVSEFHLLNPNDNGEAQPWRLEGPLCEVLRFRTGRIASPAAVAGDQRTGRAGRRRHPLRLLEAHRHRRRGRSHGRPVRP